MQVTVKYVEPRTYFVDFWQLPPSGFAVCSGPTALFSALKDERSGTDGGTSEGRWQRCPVMLGSATKGQWHSNGLKLCVCEGTNDDADYGGLFMGGAVCY